MTILSPEPDAVLRESSREMLLREMTLREMSSIEMSSIYVRNIFKRLVILAIHQETG